MSRLPFQTPSFPRASETQSANSTNITPAPNIPWHLIGAGKDHLLEQLESLYWEGVKGELEIIIRTLRTWQQPQYSSVVMHDENDNFIHGFDTFIDQVSQESRAFAARYGKSRRLLFLQISSFHCALIFLATILITIITNQTKAN
jgi:hypothetical protein